MIYLYREVLLTLLKIHSDNLGSTDTHRTIRYTLRDQKFSYKEVLTIDSVKSVCEFFSEHEALWKSGASENGGYTRKYLGKSEGSELNDFFGDAK